MYFDALSFLEDEREAWRPFEALTDVPDDRFETPVAAAHGWSARELVSHLAAYQSHALDVARELAVGERSAAYEAMEAAWAARGDAVNDELAAAWAAFPVAEVRRRARELPGELRGYLTVVPESRWVKHPVYGRHFEEELLDHYADHEADLRAILGALG
ncbi:MAG: maleylpyruvate isomerase N-terminal domain-containing protein [Chloroflexi bacterium]|nr:maleylpyruvate isomerase N-terminal domain-containing protein [Chloroflexota bacterium]